LLDLRLVQTLREVAAHGSFSDAARALHFTQPAVSRQVAQLEREVGAPLVVRSRAGVTLTDAGRLVVEHGDAIGAQLQRLEAALEQLRDGGPRRVALGGFPTAFLGLIPEMLGALREAHPTADVRLRRCGHDEALGLVRRGDLDLALVFARPELESAGIGVRLVELGLEPMLALLPAGHRYATAGEVPLAELRDEGWIVGAPDPTSSVIVAACQRAGFEPRVAFETDDALATQSLVAAGLGVSLTSPWLWKARRDDVVLRPVAPPVPTRRLQAAVPEPPGPASALLLEVARGAAGVACLPAVAA
jgi:DNA-binding transcriptional LysR family regulator